MNNITFEQFIYTYNFRFCNSSCKTTGDFDDTCIIRIYPPEEDFSPSNWFNFGLYDFGQKSYTWDICKKSLSKEILESYIGNIQYNEDVNACVTIHLTKQKRKDISY